MSPAPRDTRANMKRGCWYVVNQIFQYCKFPTNGTHEAREREGMRSLEVCCDSGKEIGPSDHGLQLWCDCLSLTSVCREWNYDAHQIRLAALQMLSQEAGCSRNRMPRQRNTHITFFIRRGQVHSRLHITVSQPFQPARHPYHAHLPSFRYQSIPSEFDTKKKHEECDALEGINISNEENCD